MGRKEKIDGEESDLQLFHPLSVPPYGKHLWRCVATRAAQWPLRSGAVASTGLVWLLDSLSLPWFSVITVLPAQLLLPDVDLLSQLFLRILGQVIVALPWLPFQATKGTWSSDFGLLLL